MKRKCKTENFNNLPSFEVKWKIDAYYQDDWRLVTVDQGIAYFEQYKEEEPDLDKSYYPEREILVRREDLISTEGQIDFDFPVKRVLILENQDWPSGVKPAYRYSPLNRIE